MLFFSVTLFAILPTSGTAPSSFRRLHSGVAEPAHSAKAKSRYACARKKQPPRHKHNVILYNRLPACILPAIPGHADALSPLYKHIMLSRHPHQPALPLLPESHKSPPPFLWCRALTTAIIKAICQGRPHQVIPSFLIHFVGLARPVSPQQEGSGLHYGHPLPFHSAARHTPFPAAKEKITAPLLRYGQGCSISPSSIPFIPSAAPLLFPPRYIPPGPAGLFAPFVVYLLELCSHLLNRFPNAFFNFPKCIPSLQAYPLKNSVAYDHLGSENPVLHPHKSNDPLKL